MSEQQTTDPQPTSPDAESPKEARARAKAEKAYERAKRPWYRKKRYILPFGIVAVIILAVAATGGGTDTESTSAPDEQQGGADEATQVGMNEPARDGRFEFTVTSFECGPERVGGQFLNEQAQGQFCLLGVTVENIGDQAQTLLAENQFLIDQQGREFSADSAATMAHEGAEGSWFSEINPGNSLKGEIVFDVPDDADIVEAELHDSSLSGGVVVNLR